MTTFITYHTVQQLLMSIVITYHTVKHLPMTTVITHHTVNSHLRLQLLPTIQLNIHL